ncbi:phosphate transport system substrate-binding protein [Desulfoluna spongiiphila]|uniref:Phosphate transport system substrate-binding protein n=1 Tax=Desulfoluna spongiiphila TaxID=419481 RepID=A0A1G5EPN8_9BACT|nr:phosphate transport system substrate-binding protein [Desulfoluna spongiiphila]
MTRACTCGATCSRRDFLKRSAAGAGALIAASSLFPGSLFAGPGRDLTVAVTGRCIFNSVVVTHETQEGFPNPFRSETPFAFSMNEDCAGLEAGVAAVRSGAADIGTLLRPLTDGEKAAGLVETPLDPMAYAVAVSKANPVNSLTERQVLEIFAGRITNWKEVGGKDMEILLYKQRCGASYDTLLDKALAERGIRKNTERLEDAVMYVEVTDNQLDEIAANEMAVAMVPRMFFDANSKHLDVDGVSPCRASEKNGRYPFLAPRSLVSRTNASDAATRFLAFAKGPHGTALMEKGFSMDWLKAGF